jgi:hypothetical protein
MGIDERNAGGWKERVKREAQSKYLRVDGDKEIT